MNGSTIMATMIEAARMPVPLGTPLVRWSHSDPGGAASISGCSTHCANTGPNTNRPHMPNTIEGMPASNSIAVPIARRRKVGHSSTRKNATPKAIGTAISNARAATSTVSTIRAETPKTPSTGSQVDVTKNDAPNLANAGQPPNTSETRMPPSVASKVVAAAKHRYSNQISKPAPLGRVRTAPPRIGLGVGPVTASVIANSAMSLSLAKVEGGQAGARAEPAGAGGAGAQRPHP